MTDKERINYIIKHSKMNMSEFARHIGIKGPHRIYDVRNERNGISKDLAHKIHAKFSNYNLGWILTGEGEVYENDENDKNEQLINDNKEEYIVIPKVSIPQGDFSSLVETLNRQQITIQTQVDIINKLSKKKDPNNGNKNIAGSA